MVQMMIWLFKRKPKSKHLHIFGQKCTYKDNRKIKKLAPRSKEGLFLGYSLDTSSFRVWPEKRMIISCDVQFFASDENVTRDNYEFVDEHHQSLNNSGVMRVIVLILKLMFLKVSKITLTVNQSMIK